MVTKLNQHRRMKHLRKRLEYNKKSLLHPAIGFKTTNILIYGD